MGRRALSPEARTQVTGPLKYLWARVKDVWRPIRARTEAYLANGDTLAKAANDGAFLVWSSQPFYPFHVWLLAGAAAWPALLTLLSTPLFFGVPLLARRSSRAGRSLFVLAGLANTLIATKAFGTASAVGWFLVPCLLIVVGLFRRSEWPLAVALGAAVALAAFATRHMGTPLETYSDATYGSLARADLIYAGILSAYLLYVTYRARRAAGT